MSRTNDQLNAKLDEMLVRADRHLAAAKAWHADSEDTMLLIDDPAAYLAQRQAASNAADVTRFETQLRSDNASHPVPWLRQTEQQIVAEVARHRKFLDGMPEDDAAAQAWINQHYDAEDRAIDARYGALDKAAADAGRMQTIEQRWYGKA